MNEHMARLGAKLDDAKFIWHKIHETNERLSKFYVPSYKIAGISIEDRLEMSKKNIERIEACQEHYRRLIQNPR